jgi:pyruvate/2-oxoacid:ferredoxin oxidoreductase beta subunit
MSNRVFLTEDNLPFCKGCGHSLISESTDKALQKLNMQLLDVVMVTDIGCHGIIDKCFRTHTVHGLHGRSVALASGISLALNNPQKKVIVYIGDGGATIGMQHLLDAAHNNFNMTVVLHNNMLYGMTGGQPSEFTPKGFKTPSQPAGRTKRGIDICELVQAAGASYVSRVIGIGDISDALAAAFSRNGFSLVEVMEICPSYAIKFNPGMKLKPIVEEAGLAVKVFSEQTTEPYLTNVRDSVESLIDSEKDIPTLYSSDLTAPLRIMLAGSAGEGVQLAAEMFAKSAISAGLNVSKKGSYPVTVGIGFSSADIIISPKKILYTGSPSPDYLIVTSQDGLDHSLPTLTNMKTGVLILDESLKNPETDVTIVRHDFRKKTGVKFAALYSLMTFLRHSGAFPPEALFDVLNNSKLGEKNNFTELFEE